MHKKAVTMATQDTSQIAFTCFVVYADFYHVSEKTSFIKITISKYLLKFAVSKLN